MTSMLTRWLAEQGDGGRSFAEERLIVATAEAIWEQMERRGVTQAEVAAALGKTKAYVSQVLSGDRNMTLRTLADIAFAIGSQVDVRLRPAMSSDAWDYSEVPMTPTRADSVVLDLKDNHVAANEWYVSKVAVPAVTAEVA